MPSLEGNHTTFNRIEDQIFKKPKLKGFTLIEMLVVIAIIGILAGIILIALGVARTKAKDARIIGEMSQIRNAAGVYYDNSTYSFSGFSCGTPNPNMSALCDDIGAQGGVLIDPFPVSGDGQDYCVEVQLNSGAWWCVDAKGRSAKYNASSPPICDDVAGVYTCE